MNIFKERYKEMGEDIEFIKGGMKKKVDVDEFTALERRVLMLEKKVK